jgi:hypothetical protein
MLAATQRWLCQQVDPVQSVPADGGAEQLPQMVFFVPWQYWLPHCPLKAQGIPVPRLPVATQAAGGLLSKKSWQDKAGKAATQLSTSVGLLPVWGAARPFSQASASRARQVLISPYIRATPNPSVALADSAVHDDRLLQRAVARSMHAWVALVLLPPLPPPHAGANAATTARARQFLGRRCMSISFVSRPS